MTDPTLTGTHPGLAGGPIYLDYNATTPVDPGVVEAMLPWLTHGFGNPSSSHAYGARAKVAVEHARRQVADLIGAADPDSIVFTGSGSEADALAIRGAVLADPRPRRHVITQATEHPAVLAACTDLRDRHNVAVTVLPVDAAGLLDPGDVARAITDNTVLVTVMHANNETGVRQPVREITSRAHEHGVLVHCDAAQSIGKVDVDVRDLGVDLLTVVGHKMYAPKGIAALYVAPGVILDPLVGGGGQEGGRRAGTENVPYIVGFGQAARLAMDALRAGETNRLKTLRDELADGLQARLPCRVHITGYTADRLPNTLNIQIDGTRALSVLAAVPELAASAGSACHSGQDTPSPVLTAMGLPAGKALTAIRLSLGRWSSADEIHRTIDLLARVVDQLQTRTEL